LKLPVIKERQMNRDAFQKRLKEQNGKEDLKGLELWTMALLHGTLRPALTGRKEPTEKSQTGEFEDPQNLE
jgi:hypothetical protein